ncbi:MAG: M28 family peptidase [Anaerolineales bacterium]|nr:M28 family peptidase [Anaerolineales bacterium]
MDDTANGMDILEKHVCQLAGRIGTRYIGSPGNKAAGEYIRAEMEQIGLAVEIQETPCPAWSVRRSMLEADGIQLRMHADPFSPPIEVTAPLVPVGTIAELERADVSGRIALLFGDLASAPISPKQWFLITEREKQVITLLEMKGPAAVLSAQPCVPYFAHGFCDADFAIPSATVPRDAALGLLRKNPAAVHLRLETERHAGSTANVVGRLAGKRRETIVLCAHYDTALETPGACDNAGGVAILLALAAHFAEHPAGCGLEFAAFSGHEYLPLGVDAYFRTADPGKIIAAINFDGAGHILGTNTLTAMAASDGLVRTAKAKLGGHPGAVWVDPWPESDHSAFAMRGVPALAFGGSGIREITHSPADTADGISGGKLNEAASLAAEIVMELKDKKVEWGRA